MQLANITGALGKPLGGLDGAGRVADGAGVDLVIETLLETASFLSADPIQARIAHDGDEPRLRRRPLQAVEEPKRAKACLLDNVLGGAGVAQQPAGEIVRGVEMNEHRRRESVLARLLTHADTVSTAVVANMTGT